MGIGAVSYARHGCFVPTAVVDFQKGERSDDLDNMRIILILRFQIYEH